MEPVRTMGTFKYVAPSMDRAKKFVHLARTDHLFASVQAVTKGGETNLHSHSHLDGFWFVLRGRARFYSDEKTLVGELGVHEGILIPRSAKYWFESSADEPLEILQVECSDIPFTDANLRDDRIDYAERKRPAAAPVASETQ
jgi:mannose-6-phosphate isomerase-like protein (cupin superfamily)